MKKITDEEVVYFNKRTGLQVECPANQEGWTLGDITQWHSEHRAFISLEKHEKIVKQNRADDRAEFERKNGGGLRLDQVFSFPVGARPLTQKERDLEKERGRPLTYSEAVALRDAEAIFEGPDGRKWTEEEVRNGTSRRGLKKDIPPHRDWTLEEVEVMRKARDAMEFGS